MLSASEDGWSMDHLRCPLFACFLKTAINGTVNEESDENFLDITQALRYGKITFKAAA